MENGTITTALNARGILTPGAKRHWHPVQVARVLARLGLA
jgi:hypothetical protein